MVGWLDGWMVGSRFEGYIGGFGEDNIWDEVWDLV